MTALFFALPLPATTREQIAGLCEALKPQLRNKRVVFLAPADLHITLLSIGEVAPEAVPALVEALASTKLTAGFELKLKDLVTFPHPKAPKTIALGTNVHPFMLKLREKLADTLISQHLDFKNNRFLPHVTLATSDTAAEALTGKIPSLNDVRANFDRVVLLAENGSGDKRSYREIASFTLA